MKTTNGIFIIDSLGKILVTHPTNHPMDLWSIPKGLTDDNETSIQSAFRETLEETTLDLNDYKDKFKLYLDLGINLYTHKKKQIHAHVVVIEDDLSNQNLNLYCDSMFYDEETGEELPENDITKWVEFSFLNDNLHYTQKIYLPKIKKIIDKLNE